MSKPASWTSREESLLLLNAYIDHELDAAAVLDVERRIASDVTLKAEYDRLVELHASLATHLKKDLASEALRRRVAAIASKPNGSRAPMGLAARSYAWRQMAAAALVGASIAIGATYLSLGGGSSSGEIASLVSNHQRALLAAAPFDVASSDRHTVKPWFDKKLALSPHIVDLSGEGFPLAGGRIDLVGGKAVPAMVYQRREHIVSVIAIPQPGDADRGNPPARATRDGYIVLSWDGPDFRYSAVSDLAEGELKEFVSSWRKSVAQR